MKAIILGVWQKAALKYDLDVSDAVILTYCKRLIAANKAHVKFGQEKTPYYYIDLEKLLENLPILNMKRPALLIRFQRYRKKGIMEATKQYLPCSGKYRYYTAMHYRFTKEGYTALFAHI